MKTSRIDSFTRKHLHNWIESGFSPVHDSEKEKTEQHMVAYLESLDDDDYSYALESGWNEVYDRSNEN